MDTFNFAIIFYMTSEFIFIFPYGGTGCWWLFLVIFLKILFNALLKRYVALQNTLLISHHFELFLLEIIEKKIFLHFLPVICYVFCPEKRTTQSHFCLFVKLNRKLSYNFLTVSNGLCHLLKYLFLFQILKIKRSCVF